jgi:hypothetical protein
MCLFLIHHLHINLSFKVILEMNFRTNDVSNFHWARVGRSAQGQWIPRVRVPVVPDPVPLFPNVDQCSTTGLSKAVWIICGFMHPKDQLGMHPRTNYSWIGSFENEYSMGISPIRAYNSGRSHWSSSDRHNAQWANAEEEVIGECGHFWPLTQWVLHQIGHLRTIDP